MAGGIGSRFWPMSTEKHPKQFLDFLGTGKSLIQMTFDRMSKIVPAQQIYVLTNSRYKELVLEQLPELTPEQVLTEPVRKNTAPCIAYAAAKTFSLNKEANLIVTPADHLILQENKFIETIERAIESSEKNRIVTIGIKPTRPDTGYGYIEFNSTTEPEPNDILPVVQFREKPDLSTAQEFLSSGNFYWNAGIFIWKSSTILDALNKHQKNLFELFASDLSKYNSSNEQEFINDCFFQSEDISIDYAIMEHADNIDVVLASFDWSDLGTWGSLYTHMEKDNDGNSIQGDKTKVFNSKGSIINIPDDVTAIIDGLEDYIVIQYEDRLMILKKEHEQDLKNFLK